MTPKFTPGPWRVEGSYGDETHHPQLAIESDFGQVTEVVGENCDIDEQVIADARLIAAAPDLYACLRRYVQWQQGHFDAIDIETEILNPAIAALAKAAPE